MGGNEVRGFVGLHSAKRADIQGLRALAIILVVAYHAGWLRGGFVGVDVFFVVSGYVITASVQRRGKAGELFSVRSFLLRRAIRLVPAMAAMLAAVQILSLAVLSPFGEVQSVIRSSLAALLSVANAFFFLQSGYFEAGTVSVPLLHTWSLSVEEQFYFSFALAFGAFTMAARFKNSDLTHRRIKQLGFSMLAVVVIVSFIGSVLLSRGVRLVPLPLRFAFFGTPVRAWEFILGALGAFVPMYQSIGLVLRRVLIAIAAASLFIASFVFSETTTWPGIPALVPVMATVVLLALGVDLPPVRQRNRFTNAVIWIGDRSYGIYLWHFPLLVLFRAAAPSLGVPDRAALLIAIAVSLLFATASWKWIERPLQEKQMIFGKGLVIVATAVMGCITSGVAISRLADTGLGLSNKTVFVEDRSMVVKECVDVPTNDETIMRCATGNSNGRLSLLLIGDSHAVSVHDGVVTAASENGIGTVSIANSGCPFLMNPVMGNESCRALLESGQGVIDARDPEIIVLANAGMRYLGVDNRIPESNGKLPQSLDDRIGSYVRSLSERVKSLQRPGRLVVVVMEAPRVKTDLRISILQRTERWADGVLSEQRDRANLWSAVATALKDEPNVKVVDLAGSLCKHDLCSIFVGDERLYHDATHLSQAGSLRVKAAFQEVFATFRAQ